MKKYIISTLILIILLSGCIADTKNLSTPMPDSQLYKDSSQPIEARVESLLSLMTLEEKIGQMTQVERGSIKVGDITRYFVGSILSGGGGSPATNTPDGWYKMVEGYQDQALATRLGIPLIYGVDAVHGHNNLHNATIFPHQIGLGAANDPKLVESIGRATAEELLATGIPWNFAPVVAVVQDVRWGRAYEGFSEETELVSRLGAAYLRGAQTLQPGDLPVDGQTLFTLATPKHYLGDGATTWGTSITNNYKLDQGDMQISEDELRNLYLPPYAAAVDGGAMSVMASFSSWNGTKMHGQKYLLSDVLKGELGFDGFIVSDWQAIDQVDPYYYQAVVTSINAGVDMNMVPYNYIQFIETMKKAVANGDIPIGRVDDAVRRILRVKFALGLFERPMPDVKFQATVRSADHIELARQAVRQSLVLLKNESQVLPIAKDNMIIFIAGNGADDLGLQSGGWTLTWQGKSGNYNEGTTILAGIQTLAGATTQVVYNIDADFSQATTEDDQPIEADVGIVVLAEQPYAEGHGDRDDIALTEHESDLLKAMRQQCARLVVILVSGRPRVITEQLPLADAWVATWLPGTEGIGIADVLFGDFPFTGKSPYSWPRSNEQLPININNAAEKEGCDAPLFFFGYGLSFGESMPEIPACGD